MPDAKIEKYITYDQLSDRISIPRKTIQNWVSTRYLEIPRPRYLGRRALFLEREVASWIALRLSDEMAGGNNTLADSRKKTAA
jgi:predicted DNA-binding transcriptional regulator AlpA